MTGRQVDGTVRPADVAAFARAVGIEVSPWQERVLEWAFACPTEKLANVRRLIDMGHLNYPCSTEVDTELAERAIKLSLGGWPA
jgi:hypothetical protein